MNLEFFPEGHVYEADGVPIPSVSEVSRFCSREIYADAVKTAVDIAADRGTRVHKGCEDLDKTGITECDPDIIPYLAAYQKFHNEHDIHWDKIEQPVMNEKDWYAGTIDRLGLVDNVLTLVDIKTTKQITGKHKLQYAVQLSLYAKALKWKWLELAILQLKDNGTYKFIKLNEAEDAANACLTLHKAFEKTKRRKNGRKNSSEGCSGECGKE